MKNLGVGIGLRRQHQNDFMNGSPQVDWLEVISENFMTVGGRQTQLLDQVLKSYLVVCHGVEMSLGSLDELNPRYVSLLKELVQKTKAPWFSDHLCFTSNEQVHFHDLIPTLRSVESVKVISEKIKIIQDVVGKPFALENISYYVEFPEHEMSEPEFIQQIIQETGCYLLLDVNNVFVNAFNHSYDPLTYLKALPLDKVIQIHLAGHFHRGDLIIDSHGDAVAPEVWDLYRQTLKLLGRPVSTLIEWDNGLPAMEVLEGEVAKAKRILKEVYGT